MSRQYTFPAFMNTSSNSGDNGIANFKYVIVSLVEFVTRLYGTAMCFVQLPLNEFQKEITLSILPVTRMFLQIMTSAVVTSRLCGDFNFLHLTYSRPFVYYGCVMKATEPSQQVAANQNIPSSLNHAMFATSCSMFSWSPAMRLYMTCPEKMLWI